MLLPLAASFAVFTLQAVEIRSIRVWTQAESTRVVVEMGGEFQARQGRLDKPARLYFDVPDGELKLANAPGKKYGATEVNDKLLVRVRAAATDASKARLVFDLADESAQYTVTELTNPSRLVVEFRAGGGRPAESGGGIEMPTPTVVAAAKAASAATPTTSPVTLPSAPPSAPKITAEEMRAAARKAAQTKAQLPIPAAAATAVPSVFVASAKETAALRVEPIPAPPAPVETKGRARKMDREPAAAVPAARAARSLTRALGLKLARIVIDPGHGGHDFGTSSPSGMHEKDLVLDVSKRLGALLEERLGAQVLYTRTEDTFVPLEGRTAFANAQRADLFVSVHANSSPYPKVAGPETFFLNFTASREAMEVAARENAMAEKSISDLQDVVRQIAMNEKLAESRDFAGKVQAALQVATRGGERTRDRGVKRAPFVVLIGASMPSILTEIGFLSNAKEEAALARPDYRQKIAEGLYRGIQQYAFSLSRFQVASRAAATEQ